MLNIKIDLPEDFWEEEIREGYTVTKEMKKVWAVELDLLNELLKVCEKYELKIFASGGTMLGSVRHQGFIPWDNDIDMMMFRDDYEKLCKIANTEFKYPYFFQTEYTDPGCLRGHAQLRNSDTTGILKSEYGGCTFNQGIFIDIFPQDVVIENKWRLNIQIIQAKVYKKIAKGLYRYVQAYDLREKSVKTYVYHFIALMINAVKGYEYWFRCLEETCKKYNHIEAPTFCSFMHNFAQPRFVKYRKDYENLIDMPFEVLKIKVAQNYDHALTTLYGDWRKLVKGADTHGEVIFDTEVSYKQYIRKD